MTVVKIEGGVVVERLEDVADLDALAAKYGLSGSEYVVADEYPGRLFDGEVFSSAPPPTAEEIAAQASIDVREIRKQLLETKVDPLVSNPLRWNDLTVEQQASVTAYRQALLDVTDQEGFPMDVVWPEWPLG